MKLITLSLIIVTSIYSKSIKISSYNVDNLFDNHIDGSEYSIYKSTSCQWNSLLVQQKLKNTTKIICDIDADIIALQEVENQNILHLLQKKLRDVGCAYEYSAITKKPHTTIHNALLSKIPIKLYPDILIDKKKKYRSILHVSIGSKKELHIFANHWKAKNRNGQESKRVKYATALINAIKALPKKAEYIILGDFNSNYDEFAHLDKNINDTNGITGINDILHTYKNHKLISLDNLSENYHYNLWLELPKSQRWSRRFFDKRDSMDTILIPPTMIDDTAWEYKADSFDVIKEKYLLNKYGTPKRWKKDGCHFAIDGYSDHLPIIATFEYHEQFKAKDKGWLKDISTFFKNETADTTLKKHKHNIKTATIAEIKETRTMTSPLFLKSLTVVLKSKDTAIVHDNQHSNILLYKCARGMKVGYKYDIIAKTKKIYNSQSELTDIEYTKERKSDLKLRHFSASIMNKKNIGEVITDIQGVYFNKNILIDSTKYKIYFKKSVKRPNAGETIIITKAQIWEYKNQLELVIWDESDYRIPK